MLFERKNNLISIGSCFVLMAVMGSSLEYPLYEGSECQLRNGAIGICRSIRKCPGAIKNRFGSPSQNVRCGFEGVTEIICCKQAPTTPPPEAGNGGDEIYFKPDNDWSPWTPAPPRSRPTKRVLTKPTVATASRVVERKATKECKAYKAPLSVNTNIINGESASEGEFPHMAALGYMMDTGLQFDCGGSLISDRFVLTAAHCINTPNEVKPSLVRLGSLSIDVTETNTNNIDYYIEQDIIHPNYVRKIKYHDIALLKLNTSVTFTNNIFPACLYTSQEDPKTALTVTGWGTTDTKRDSKSSILLKALISAMSLSECNETYTRSVDRRLPNGLTNQQMCAVDSAGGGQDSCTGDSGGPLQIFNNVDGMHNIVGITSFSYGECGKGIPGVYIRVAGYLDWIEPIVWP